MRARVLARDVSVTRRQPVETSVVNVLPVSLESLVADRSTALLRLVVGPPGWGGTARAEGVRLLARVTRRSCDALALQPGDALFAQIKGVALM